MHKRRSKLWESFAKPELRFIFALLLTERAMAVTRLKRKNRKDKAKAAVRRQTLKIQNFQPVMKNVDIDQVKEEFKKKASAKKA
jgi:hypothetical protein